MVQTALETVEVQQFAVHRQGVLRLLRHHSCPDRSSRRSRRLLRPHRNSCGRFRGSSSSRRRLSTRQVLLIQSPEDRVCPTGTGHGHDRQFPNCDTTPSTDNPDESSDNGVFSVPSSLFVEDLPEMGQRQDQTEKMKTAANTQGQIAGTFSDHPEDPEVCRGTTSCSETEDRPEIQKTVKIPQIQVSSQ